MGSLAHIWPMPNNTALSWGMCSWGSSGRWHVPGTVPSRWHLAWEVRRGHSEPFGCRLVSVPRHIKHACLSVWSHDLSQQPDFWDNPTTASPHFFPAVGIESAQYQSQSLYKHSSAVGFLSVCSVIASTVLNAGLPIPLSSTSGYEEKHYRLRNSRGCGNLLT